MNLNSLGLFSDCTLIMPVKHMEKPIYYFIKQKYCGGY